MDLLLQIQADQLGVTGAAAQSSRRRRPSARRTSPAWPRACCRTSTPSPSAWQLDATFAPDRRPHGRRRRPRHVAAGRRALAGLGAGVSGGRIRLLRRTTAPRRRRARRRAVTVISPRRRLGTAAGASARPCPAGRRRRAAATVRDVEQVEALVGVERRVVPGLDLPQAGDAGADLVAGVQLGRELVDLSLQCRPGPDEAHVALEHVEQLRQLVEAGAAQDVADAGDPGVDGELEQRAGALVVGLHGGQPGLGVDDHRAELEHPELDAARGRRAAGGTGPARRPHA